MSAPLTPEARAHLRELATRATPPPWDVEYDTDDLPDDDEGTEPATWPVSIGPFNYVEHDMTVGLLGDGEIDRESADAEFVSHARALIVPILDALDEAERLALRAMDDLAAPVTIERTEPNGAQCDAPSISGWQKAWRLAYEAAEEPHCSSTLRAIRGAVARRKAVEEKLARLEAAARAALGMCSCRGTGTRTRGCTLCGDSTYDHACNDTEVPCADARCAGLRDALEAKP